MGVHVSVAFFLILGALVQGSAAQDGQDARQALLTGTKSQRIAALESIGKKVDQESFELVRATLLGPDAGIRPAAAQAYFSMALSAKAAGSSANVLKLSTQDYQLLLMDCLMLPVLQAELDKDDKQRREIFRRILVDENLPKTYGMDGISLSDCVFDTYRNRAVARLLTIDWKLALSFVSKCRVLDAQQILRFVRKREGDLVAVELTKLLKDPKPFIRVLAVYAVNGRPNSEALIRALANDSYGEVRQAVAKCLGDFSSDEARKVLTTLTTDKVEAVRNTATTSLRFGKGS